MADSNYAANDTVPTLDEALKNAARLYRNAELETDLQKMQRVEGLGDSWLAMANLLAAREQSAS